MSTSIPTPMWLCFVVDRPLDDETSVLLGHKKRGLGTGNIVGLGGHIDPGESAREAAAREGAEESGLRVSKDDLQHRADVVFTFPARPSWDQTAAVFVTDRWHREPRSTEEITPEWFPPDALHSSACGTTRSTGCPASQPASISGSTSSSETTAGRSPPRRSGRPSSRAESGPCPRPHRRARVSSDVSLPSCMPPARAVAHPDQRHRRRAAPPARARSGSHTASPVMPIASGTCTAVRTSLLWSRISPPR